MRMRKVKFMAMVMVAALMLMGVGYAAWTDTLILNTTVETGKLEVDFKAAPAFSAVSDYVETHTATAAGDDTYTVSLGKLYPGATATLTFTAVNNGTMGVQELLKFSNPTAGDTLTLSNLKVKVNGDTDTDLAALIAGGPITLNNNIAPAGEQTVTLVFTLNPALEGDDQENTTATFNIEVLGNQFVTATP